MLKIIDYDAYNYVDFSNILSLLYQVQMFLSPFPLQRQSTGLPLRYINNVSYMHEVDNRLFFIPIYYPTVRSWLFCKSYYNIVEILKNV